jgi:hypothetical protein
VKHLHSGSIGEIGDDLDPRLLVGRRSHEQDRYRAGDPRLKSEAQGWVADNGSDLSPGNQVRQGAWPDPHTENVLHL